MKKEKNLHLSLSLSLFFLLSFLQERSVSLLFPTALLLGTHTHTHTRTLTREMSQNEVKPDVAGAGDGGEEYLTLKVVGGVSCLLFFRFLLLRF